MTSDPIVGRRRFTDGSTRDVFVDDVGQYVIGDDGRPVRGVWLMTDQDEEADAPLMIYASQKSGG